MFETVSSGGGGVWRETKVSSGGGGVWRETKQFRLGGGLERDETVSSGGGGLERDETVSSGGGGGSGERRNSFVFFTSISFEKVPYRDNKIINRFQVYKGATTLTGIHARAHTFSISNSYFILKISSLSFMVHKVMSIRFNVHIHSSML